MNFPYPDLAYFIASLVLLNKHRNLIPNACLSWSINLQPCSFYRLVSMLIVPRPPLVIAAFIASNRTLLSMSTLHCGSKLSVAGKDIVVQF